MSFTFSIASKKPPLVQEIFAHASLEPIDFTSEEEIPQEGPWPKGDVVHFYQPGKTTRGIEVDYDKKLFNVRINTLAHPHDYDLGFRFLEAVAAWAGNELQTEEGDTIPVEQLREKYDKAWIDEQNDAGFQMIISMLFNEDENERMESCILQGPVRPFHLGPRVWNEIAIAGPENQMRDRLLEKMRQVQDVSQDFYAAELMTVETATKEQFDISILVPGAQLLMPSAEFLIMAGENEGDDSYRVPSKDVWPLIPKEKFAWLDEEQTLIQPLTSEEWTKLIEDVQPFVVETLSAEDEKDE